MLLFCPSFFPRFESLFHFQSSLNLCNGDTTGGFAAEGSSQHENEVSENFKSGERVGKMSTSGSVACPVCGSSIRDEDYVINSHLSIFLYLLFLFFFLFYVFTFISKIRAFDYFSCFMYVLSFLK